MDSLAALPWKSQAPSPIIGKDEKLIFESRHHWMKHVMSFCVYLLLFPPCLLAINFIDVAGFPREFSTVVFFCLLVTVMIVQHWFFHSLLSENATDIILTNKRIFYLVHRLWLHDSMDELVIKKIKMVKVDRRGIVRHLLNYGELGCHFDIDSGKTLQFVPAPQVWARKIEDMIGVE